MTINVQKAGTDLDSVLAQRTTGWPQAANTGIQFGGVDLATRYATAATGSAAATLNLQKAGVDLSATFASLNSTNLSITSNGSAVSGSAASSSVTSGSTGAAAATHGSGTYTYSWSVASVTVGSTPTITTPTASSTTVSATGIPSSTTWSGTLHCTISDANPAPGQTSSAVTTAVAYSLTNTTSASLTFTAATTLPTGVIAGVAYGTGSTFCCCNTAGQIFQSTNSGTTWTQVLSSGLTYYNIAYVNGTFIAYGNGGSGSGAFSYSTTGNSGTWTSVSTGLGDTTANNVMGVAFIGSVFVFLVGSNGGGHAFIYTATTVGGARTSQSLGAGLTNTSAQVVFGVGAGNNAIANSGSVLATIISNGAGSTVYAVTSANGTTWTTTATAALTTYIGTYTTFANIAWSSGTSQFILYGNGQFATSAGGTTWSTPVSGGANTFGTRFSVVNGAANPYWVLSGFDGTTSQTAASYASSSPTTISYTHAVVNGAIASGFGEAVAFGNSTYVLVGTGGYAGHNP